MSWSETHDRQITALEAENARLQQLRTVTEANLQAECADHERTMAKSLDDQRRIEALEAEVARLQQGHSRLRQEFIDRMSEWFSGEMPSMVSWRLVLARFDMAVEAIAAVQAGREEES
jgi:hypothetical protein